MMLCVYVRDMLRSSSKGMHAYFMLTFACRAFVVVAPYVVHNLRCSLDFIFWGRRSSKLYSLPQLLLVGMCTTNLRILLCRSFGKVRAATASLVWSLLEKPEVLRHEFCKPVSTLLTSVVYTPKETMNNQNNFQQFLERYSAATVPIFFAVLLAAVCKGIPRPLSM